SRSGGSRRPGRRPARSRASRPPSHRPAPATPARPAGRARGRAHGSSDETSDTSPSGLGASTPVGDGRFRSADRGGDPQSVVAPERALEPQRQVAALPEQDVAGQADALVPHLAALVAV